MVFLGCNSAKPPIIIQLQVPPNRRDALLTLSPALRAGIQVASPQPPNSSLT
jgi:hypothetical protein